MIKTYYERFASCLSSYQETRELTQILFSLQMCELLLANAAQSLVNEFSNAWCNLLTKKESCTEKLKVTNLQILELEEALKHDPALLSVKEEEV